MKLLFFIKQELFIALTRGAGAQCLVGFSLQATMKELLRRLKWVGDFVF